MSNYSFELKKSYNFNTLPVSLLGAVIKNAKLLGIMDYEMALKYDNIALKYRQIFPALPAGTPDQPEACTYYLFQSESGEKVVFADQWIDMTTVQVVQHVNFQVTFTEANLEDISHVRDLLNAAGYRNYVIKQT